MNRVKGVAQDYAEALRWYRAAAERGNAAAQFNLGCMYDNGLGADQDHAEAARWFRAAAEQGNAEGQFYLGLMYANGQGVAQDYVTAHMWLNIAASSGHHPSQEMRDRVSANMTPEAIGEAHRRSQVCIESGYQDCD